MTLAEELSALLPPSNGLPFGQLWLSRDPSGKFSACHLEDRDTPGPLEVVATVRGLREVAKFDASGAYRPLKTAPTLRRGWSTSTDSPAEFLARLDAVYPGAFATWAAWSGGRIEPVPLRETLNRQTGMYRLAGTVPDEQARRIPELLCQRGCLRRILWPLSRSAPGSTSRPALPSAGRPGPLGLICTEACTFAVSLARELAKEARKKARS